MLFLSCLSAMRVYLSKSPERWPPTGLMLQRRALRLASCRPLYHGDGFALDCTHRHSVCGCRDHAPATPDQPRNSRAFAGSCERDAAESGPETARFGSIARHWARSSLLPSLAVPIRFRFAALHSQMAVQPRRARIGRLYQDCRDGFFSSTRRLRPLLIISMIGAGSGGCHFVSLGSSCHTNGRCFM